jgi:phosphomevalonate kinase
MVGKPGVTVSAPGKALITGGYLILDPESSGTHAELRSA